MKFLRNLFGRSYRQKTLLPFALPNPEQMVYVIGDVHGRMDLLEQLLDKIGTDKAVAADHDRMIVFVGDLIDRGDASRAVLETVFTLTQSDLRVICIMGNHEKMLLDFLDHPEKNAKRWFRNGGLQTLASFGILGISGDVDSIKQQNTRDKFLAAMQNGMEYWLRNLPLIWQSGTLVVVHGAVDPNRRVDEQSEDTLLWGNAAFNRTRRKDGLWVAHGHTVVDPPYCGNGRISVDTGAYFSGRLTAAAIDPSGAVRFLSTR